MFYAGIGSRETPDSILNAFEAIGESLAVQILHSRTAHVALVNPLRSISLGTDFRKALISRNILPFALTRSRKIKRTQHSLP